LELAIWAKLAGLALLLFTAILAAAGQASLFHLNRARLHNLRDQGARRADAVLRVLEQPSSSFGTVAAVYTVSIALAAAVTFLIDLELARGSPWIAFGVSVTVLLAALLLQLLARVIAIAKPEATALRLYRPLSLTVSLFAPVILPLRLLERWLLARLGVSRLKDPRWEEEELRLLVESSDQPGVLEEEEREMIHGIFELSEVTVREIMVPRIDVVGVSVDSLVSDLLDVIVRTGHSRLPLYDGSMDNILGIIHAKDLLKHLRDGKLDDPVRPLARGAYFIPEAKKVGELLQELQQRRVHMAVVVDEYGGTAGLVTIEDLIEEIVGEIRDEYDQAEEARIEQISKHEAILDARTPIREVNEVLDLDLPDDEFDTLGGLVYDRLGKVPSKDDAVRVDGCDITVLSTEGRRIKKIRLVVDLEAQSGSS
jgi:CBS domain containing-hemolysin-like protein